MALETYGFLVVNVRTDYALALFSSQEKAVRFISEQEALCAAFEGALRVRCFHVDGWAEKKTETVYEPSPTLGH